MKIKTNELTGVALDWAVAKSEGMDIEGGTVITNLIYIDRDLIERPVEWNPSEDWAQGGPIIEREHIELRPGSFIGSKDYPRLWAAWAENRYGNRQQGKTGPTPLIAAMRCFVASKLGDEVEIPDEVLRLAS